MRIINKIIYLVGLFIIGISWYQWFIRFQDTSQLIIGTSIGIVFLGFGYIYSWMKNQENLTNKLDKQIEGIKKIYIGGEFE